MNIANTDSTQTIRIATRQSPLALWQAEHVRRLLEQAQPGLSVELLPMTTEGDRFLDGPLIAAGGKGLFIKELEHALLEGRADLAVHSMKDVPPAFPDGLQLTAILAREDPRDAFVSNHHKSIDSIPENAIIGTASLRRQSQIKARLPNCDVRLLRGNVGTRLAKLDANEFDAILLASAGLKRLGLKDRIAEALTIEQLLPAPGQGAIGIESRTGDKINALLARLADAETSACVTAERAVATALGGNCRTPLAAHATQHANTIQLQALVASPDGKTVLRASNEFPAPESAQGGAALAEELRASGADDILQACVGL